MSLSLRIEKGKLKGDRTLEMIGREIADEYQEMKAKGNMDERKWRQK